MTWNAPPNVTLQGAGIDQTVIVDNYANGAPILQINTNESGTFRMTGVTFRGGNGSIKYGMVVIAGSSKLFRMDHVRINMQTYSPANNGHALRFYGHVNGVIDHSIFDLHSVGSGVQVWFDGYGPGGQGDEAFAVPTDFGGSDFIFVEDSTFNADSQYGSANDCTHGGKWVFRNNTITSSGLQTHPTGGSGRGRGCRAWEAYRNTFLGSNDNPQFNVMFASSGTGLIWGNSAPAGYTHFVTLHSMRRNNGTYPESPTPNGWGYCGTSFTGTGSNWDQNGPVLACFDQPGRGVGDLLSGAFPNVINQTTGCDASRSCAWPRQALEPIYEWSNIWSKLPNDQWSSFFAPYEDVFLENRDYYLQTPSFNGSSGTGTGLIANRPSTCTPGVAYWATDEGEWDSTHAGPDGRLYKCTATNTWSLYYTPYAYPHPLAALNGTATLTGGTTTSTTAGTTATTDMIAPTAGNSGLIAAAATTDSATLNWTKATDNATVQSALQYELRLSTSNDISTVADAESYGAIAQPYTTDISSAVVKGWTPGTTYFFNVIVKDSAGNKAAYSTKSVTSTGSSSSDATPPAPGNSGSITATSTSNSATLNWTKATDNVSAQSALQYEVLLSTRNDIGTLAGAETYGALVKSFAADINSYLVTGLDPGKTYYFNVIVKDEAGNKASYTMKNVTTTSLLDTTAPVPGNSGIITTSANPNSVTLVWGKASDNASAQSALQYEVRLSASGNIGSLEDAELNGAVGQRYTTDINTATINGLNSGTTYYFNVIVKDEAGNKAAYSMRSQTTGGKKATQTTNTNYRNGVTKNGNLDTNAPVPGASGALTISGVNATGLTLSWTMASDDVSVQAALQYEVLRSSSENMGNVTDAEANGTAILFFTPNINSYIVQSLLNAGQYYYTVVVKDEAGNKAVYATAGSTGVKYSFPAGGAKTIQTSSLATSSLSMNHVRIVPNSGTALPAGLAIVRYAPNNKLVSEAGFGLSPLMQLGSIYADMTAATDTVDGTTTGIALSNPSSQDAQVSYSFLDSTGAQVKSGLYVLPANHQLSAFLDQSPFSGPAAFRGTFTFSSSTPISAVAMRGITNKAGQFLFSSLPIAANAAADNPVLPLFVDGGGWSTQVILMNRSSVSQNGTVQFFGSAASSALEMTVNGVTGTSFNYSIPPHSVNRFGTAGINPLSSAGSVRVTPSNQDALTAGAAPDVFGILSLKSNGTTVSEATIMAATTGTAFRTYVEAATTPEPVNSSVSIANPAATPTVVTFQFMQLDGTPVGSTQSVTIPAGAQLSRYVRELYAGLADPFQGVLRITSSAPISVIAFRARYNAQGAFVFTPTPPVNEANPTSVISQAFPMVATGAGYNTQLVLFGPSGEAGAGELQFLSSDGTPRAGSSLGIVP